MSNFTSGQILTASQLTAAFAEKADAAFTQSGTGAVARTVQDELSRAITPQQFGAKADYVTDDTAAIIVADAAAAAAGKPLFFYGVYGCTNGITRTARWCGAGAPALGTFAIGADAKNFLRPGYKAQLPGAALIFKGTGTATATTARTDRFASFTYCVMDSPTAQPGGIEGLSIVMDMNVYDASGNLTGVANDARASYDVGHFITGGWNKFADRVVFGYFPKAGTVIYGQDIDYNMFDSRCSTSGDIGLAIVGNGTNGLSATRFDGQLYANDHHSRSIVDNQWGTTALYIDGAVSGASAPQNSIGGHRFIGGSLRTYCNNPFSLGYANTVVFEGMVFEWPNMAGSTGATYKQPLATANTYGVSIINCRHDNPLGAQSIYAMAPMMGGAFLHIDPRYGNFGVAYAGKGSMMRASGGNPTLQLTSDITSSTSDWTLLENLSSSNRFEMRYANAAKMTVDNTGVLNANRLVAVLTGSTTATDPALRLSASDTASGLYRPSPNTVGVTINGVSAALWSSSGNLMCGATTDDGSGNKLQVSTGISISPATTTTAPSAGSAGALPSAPAGYMTINVNGAARKVAYY